MQTQENFDIQSYLDRGKERDDLLSAVRVACDVSIPYRDWMMLDALLSKAPSFSELSGAQQLFLAVTLLLRDAPADPDEKCDLLRQQLPKAFEFCQLMGFETDAPIVPAAWHLYRDRDIDGEFFRTFNWRQALEAVLSPPTSIN